MQGVNIILILYVLTGCTGSESGQSSERPVTRQTLWAAEWSPNGDRFTVGGNQDTLRIFSAADFESDQAYPVKGTITKITWHPTDNLLAVSVQGDSTASFILDLKSGNTTYLDSLNEFGARAIGWNFTGEYLAVGDYDGNITLFDRSGVFIKQITSGQKGITGLDWHPHENSIAAVGEYISLYDFDSDSLIKIEDRPEDVLMLSVDWHPSGDFFATGDYGDFDYNFSPLLQFWSKQGELKLAVDKSIAEYRNLSWSPDGGFLATASDKIRLWDIEGKLLAEGKPDEKLWGISINKHSEEIITTDDKGNILIWTGDLTDPSRVTY